MKGTEIECGNPFAEPLWSHRLADRGHRGLFIIEVERTPSALVIQVFTSRPLTSDELRERLWPSDSARTEYVLRTVVPEVIDGKGVVEFAPSPPLGLTWLQIEDRPGAALIMAVQSCKDERRSRE